jgi:hypothetical protein
MLLDNTILHLIKRGHKNNLLVYDSKSSGVMSRRLLHLMWEHAEARGLIPDRIILPKCRSDVDLWFPYETFMFKRVDPHRFCGIELEFIEGLYDREEYGNYFKVLGGRLLSGQSALCIIADKDDCILGAY